MTYVAVKLLHVLSSTVLFGTGLGSAYYMYFASRTRDARVAAAVVRQVVIADWVFTTTTIVFQPVSGAYLVHVAGFPWSATWIVWSFVLYLVAGACWLPVVWMQIRMRDIATQAAAAGEELPALYWTYLRRWIALGVPAFTALVAVFWLMIAKPI
jgi:uncharacterized membrane protein